MTDLPSLIVRVERLEGPDREVDLEIARALVPDVICTRLVRWPPPEREEDFTHWEYTASLDAVVALAERVKPSWRWAVTNADGPNRWPAQGELWIGDHEYIGKHAYPTLALLLALLRAVQAQQNKETT